MLTQVRCSEPALQAQIRLMQRLTPLLGLQEGKAVSVFVYVWKDVGRYAVYFNRAWSLSTVGFSLC